MILLINLHLIMTEEQIKNQKNYITIAFSDLVVGFDNKIKTEQDYGNKAKYCEMFKNFIKELSQITSTHTQVERIMNIINSKTTTIDSSSLLNCIENLFIEDKRSNIEDDKLTDIILFLDKYYKIFMN